MEKEELNTTNKTRLSVIIPCYNEEENIHRVSAELIPELDKLGTEYEILFIDDGSSDNTVSAVENLKIPQLRVIRHEKNLGLGGATKTGFAAARYDACMTYDADFAYPAEYISPLVNRFLRGDVDFVSGSPELANFGKNMPLYRKIISRSANFIYNLVLGKKFTAATHTFRIFKTCQVKELNLETDGFDIGAEILFKMIKNKRSFAEIPTPLTQRFFGESKLDYKKEIFNHLKLIRKILKWRFNIL